MPTLLAIGAHYDDCVFGVPGILLHAVRKNYRVVILSLIGDYSNWPPTRGRGAELIDGTTRISREYGVEMLYLKFASQRFDVGPETKQAVATVVAEVKPDIAFTLCRTISTPTTKWRRRSAKWRCGTPAGCWTTVPMSSCRGPFICTTTVPGTRSAFSPIRSST